MSSGMQTAQKANERYTPRDIQYHIKSSRNDVDHIRVVRSKRHSGDLVLGSVTPGKQRWENIAFPFYIWLDREVGQPNLDIPSMFLQCSLPGIGDPSKKSPLCKERCSSLSASNALTGMDKLSWAEHARIPMLGPRWTPLYNEPNERWLMNQFRPKMTLLVQ